MTYTNSLKFFTNFRGPIVYLIDIMTQNKFFDIAYLFITETDCKKKIATQRALIKRTLKHT